MTSINTSKGGDNREALYGAVDGDSFVLSSGNIVESILIKELDNTGGNIAIGSDAKYETSTLKVTATPSAPGNITIALGGNNNVIAVKPKTLTVPVLTGAEAGGGVVLITVKDEALFAVSLLHADNTAGEVATRIAGTSWPSGYTASADGTNLIVSKDSGDWDAVDLTIAESDIGPVTVSKRFETLITVLTGDDGTGGTITVTVGALAPVTITLLAADDTPEEVATKIGAGVYTGYTTTVVGATVQFAGVTPSTSPFNVVIADVSTGATFDSQRIFGYATLTGTATGNGSMEIQLDSATPVYALVSTDDTAATIATNLAALSVAGYSIDSVGSGSIRVYKQSGDITTFVVEEGTSGATFGTITESGTGTILDLINYLSSQSYTAGYTKSDDNVDTLTFTKTAFGNVTDMAFTDTGFTLMTATATTTIQGIAGNGLVDSVALSGTSGTITTLSLLATGRVQSMTADTTLYLNIDSAASVDLYVLMQKID